MSHWSWSLAGTLFLRTSTNPRPRPVATRGPSRQPRDSRPSMTVGPFSFANFFRATPRATNKSDSRHQPVTSARSSCQVNLVRSLERRADCGSNRFPSEEWSLISFDCNKIRVRPRRLTLRQSPLHQNSTAFLHHPSHVHDLVFCEFCLPGA